jgi:hypothetical protein
MRAIAKSIIERTRNMSWIDLIHLLVIIGLGIGEILLAVLTLNVQIASRRADISILVDPARNQNWTFVVPGGAYLTVNGTFCNEGTRTAIIKELELSMIYRLSNDQYILTRTYSDPARVCNWNNNTITEDELRPFSLTMYVDSYTILDSRTGQTVSIGNSRSDEFGLSVTYYDGLSDTKSEQIFNTKS